MMTKTSSIARSIFTLGSAAVMSLLLLGPAAAQSNSFPNKEITYILPYGPGAAGDILARKYTAVLNRVLNTPVVVSNVPGGAGTIGSVEIFGAEPDGYTIGYGHNSPLAIQPHKNADLPFRNIEDFTAIGGIGHQSAIIAVGPDAPWKSFSEFLAAAKADPGVISIAVGQAGNIKEMQLRQFEQAADVEFNIVPFAGGAEAVTAVMGGIVDAVSVATSSVRGQIASGDILPLAIFADSTEKEIDGFEVVHAEDYPGLNYIQDSSGIIGPKGISEDILAILVDAHQKVMADPEFVAALLADGYIIDAASPEVFRKQFLADYANFGDLLGK